MYNPQTILITVRRITMRTLRTLSSIVVCLLVVSFLGRAENKYTGSKFCSACHKAGKGGTAYAVWEKTAHAKAYKTLLGDEAKKIAKEKGLKVAPAESEECLQCHVTGGGKAENVEKSFKIEEGVGCEACHGPASGYKLIHIKGDLAKSKAAGMIIPEKDEKQCVTCHNKKSPVYKPFKFDEMWAKIEHGLPVKK
jgi:hypothetical protein